MSLLAPGALALTLATSAGGGLPARLSLEVPPLHLAAARVPLGEPAPGPPPAPSPALAVEAEPAGRARSSTPVRLLAETGGAVGLGLVGGLAGAWTGGALCRPSGGGWGCLGDMLLGAAIGGVLGSSGGATLGGYATGGDGSFLLSLVGGTLGFAAGVALQSEAAVMLGTAAGSVGGYELGHAF